MVTTIQISDGLWEILNNQKRRGESFDKVIKIIISQRKDILRKKKSIERRYQQLVEKTGECVENIPGYNKKVIKDAK